jgi:hypothetical protein
MEGQLGLHLVNTLDCIVVTDVVDGVGDAPAGTSIADGRGWPGAVTANVNCLALTSLEVVSDVLHARGMVETGIMCILVN